MVMAGHSHVFGGEEQLPLAIADHPDPFVLELTRLQNQLKEKDRKLGAAQAEIKALRATEALKDKVIEELGGEVQKLDEKHRVAENLLQQKNLEMKKLADEKKDAVAAQFAAEATLRRVYANQKDDEDVSMESIIAPLKDEIKMYKNEIAVLHQDKKALERLTKSKESALIEAERILRSALERALIVEEVQNQNLELRRQIEICQASLALAEENKILEKTNRQKVLEIEKLSQTIKELEEAILVGGAAANSIRDCRRQISQLRKEKRTLERELARVKVLANRVATVVANEWKDENDKVMPVKQWLEDRRLLQAEMQRLKDKLSMSERTAKAEAQLKDKFKLRLKILEDGLNHVSSISINPNASYGSPKPEKSSNILGFLTSTGGLKKRSTSQPRASIISTSSPLQRPRATSGENMVRKKLWASRCKVADSNEKENAEMKVNGDSNIRKDGDTKDSAEIKSNGGSNEQTGNRGIADSNAEDMVSGFLYDRLQKEVINLRKLCEAKDSSLNTKDEEIKMLMKKVEAFSRAMKVEAKRVKRESLAKEKENGSAKMDDDTKKMKHINSSKTRRLVLTLKCFLLIVVFHNVYQKDVSFHCKHFCI
ncbi:microtubule-associated protein 70-5-like isoform X2 [Gossypium australe]|uniref:Microtubule-associated protein 70-5-like isoform X2 n=1 Tax=Gossypium australe TaxID=47621 RepID=A0A5B6X927_9ROSI|nr:microtubule-associated protein 70-5-like isoform X2 [Gossypium australe]